MAFLLVSSQDIRIYPVNYIISAKKHYKIYRCSMVKFCQEVIISNSHVNYELVRKMEVIKKTDSLFVLSVVYLCGM